MLRRAVLILVFAIGCGGKVFVDQPSDGGVGGDGGAPLTGPTCESCDGLCVDLANDTQNCGACAHDCPLTETCVAGECSGTPCFIGAPCSNCCGDVCCGLEELCCGNSSIGFSCIDHTGFDDCPNTTCSGGCL